MGVQGQSQLLSQRVLDNFMFLVVVVNVAWPVARHVTYNTSNVKRHTSHVTHNASHCQVMTRYTSHITCHLRVKQLPYITRHSTHVTRHS